MNKKKISNDPFGFGLKPIKAPNFKLPKTNSFDYTEKKLAKVTPIDFGFKSVKNRPVGFGGKKLARSTPLDFGIKPIKSNHNFEFTIPKRKSIDLGLRPLQTNPTNRPKTNPIFGGKINPQTNAYRNIVPTSIPLRPNAKVNQPRATYPTARTMKLSDYYRQIPARNSYPMTRTINRSEIRPIEKIPQKSTSMSLLEKLSRLDQIAQQPTQEARFSQIHNELANSQKQINELASLIKEIKENYVKSQEDRVSSIEKTIESMQQTLGLLLEKYGITEEQLIDFLKQEPKPDLETKPEFKELLEQVQKLTAEQQELAKYKPDIEHLHKVNVDESKDTSLS